MEKQNESTENTKDSSSVQEVAESNFNGIWLIVIGVGLIIFLVGAEILRR